CITAPPVKGVLSLTPKTRNPFFKQYDSFLKKSEFPNKIIALGSQYFADPGSYRSIITRSRPSC
ncbi:hypothetical protein SAMN05444149_104557, partial [Pseudosulfitobacter pseudonitzschiae]